MPDPRHNVLRSWDVGRWSELFNEAMRSLWPQHSRATMHTAPRLTEHAVGVAHLYLFSGALALVPTIFANNPRLSELLL